MKIKDIISYLASIAPPEFQESYDNSGLIVGNPSQEVTGVLVTLDCIEEIIDEAIAQNINLVVAHHPIVFSGIKKLNGKNYVERTVIKAVKHDIAIYAIHTNLDNVIHGVNHKISSKLGLENVKILSPKKNTLLKLTTFVPNEHKNDVLAALSEAGAGNIGNYEECSFQLEGQGTFKPNAKANPHIGEQGKLEHVAETRIEVILPFHLKGRVLNAMRQAHPYEEVAYYLNQLDNTNQEVGSGMVGKLPEALSLTEFLDYLKTRMELSCIRHTKLLDKKIQKVALCGGAGSFLLRAAKSAKADVFITGDFKYHEFFDAEDQIIIADIGHFESEKFTRELLYDLLVEAFPKVKTTISKVDTNPVNYYF